MRTNRKPSTATITAVDGMEAQAATQDAAYRRLSVGCCAELGVEPVEEAAEETFPRHVHALFHGLQDAWSRTAPG